MKDATDTSSCYPRRGRQWCPLFAKCVYHDMMGSLSTYRGQMSDSVLILNRKAQYHFVIQETNIYVGSSSPPSASKPALSN